MSDWSDVVAATERFSTVSRRHHLTLVTELVAGVDERGPLLSVELHSDDRRLMLAHFVPVSEGAEWIDALGSVLDVPTGQLAHPDRWPEITDQVLEHRRALDGLPILDDPRG